VRVGVSENVVLEGIVAGIGHRLLDKAGDQLLELIFPRVDVLYHRLAATVTAEFARGRLAWLGAGRDLLNFNKSAEAVTLLTIAKHNEPHSALRTPTTVRRWLTARPPWSWLRQRREPTPRVAVRLVMNLGARLAGSLVAPRAYSPGPLLLMVQGPPSANHTCLRKDVSEDTGDG
jgi:hypothetical protein